MPASVEHWWDVAQLMAETNANNRIQLNFLCIESCMDREIETSKRFCL